MARYGDLTKEYVRTHNDAEVVEFALKHLKNGKVTVLNGVNSNNAGEAAVGLGDINVGLDVLDELIAQTKKKQA